MSDSRLAELIALSAQPSSERRRTLLREVTDLFMATDAAAQMQSSDAFDAVLQALSVDMEAEVRAELAGRLAHAAIAPPVTLRRLANDSIDVAAPVLRHSRSLSEADLLSVVNDRGQAHMQLISTRRDLSEGVADAIMARGDDVTVGILLHNADAPLSRHAAEAVVDRAQTNPALHEAVVSRETLPPDLLNEMYFVVEARLRQKITRRNAALDSSALEAAIAAGRARVASRDGALPADYAEARAHVQTVMSHGRAIGSILPTYLRAGERTRFLVAMSELTQVEFSTVARVVDRRELDALAILCKAAGLDRALFLTLAVMIDEPGKGMAKAQEYGRLYVDLTKDTALRTLRFWRMRREGDLAAA